METTKSIDRATFQRQEDGSFAWCVHMKSVTTYPDGFVRSEVSEALTPERAQEEYNITIEDVLLALTPDKGN